MDKTYILRQRYIEIVKPFIGKAVIKVFTGQRRVGKSYLMVQVADTIKQTDKNASIIYIDKEKYGILGKIHKIRWAPLPC